MQQITTIKKSLFGSGEIEGIWEKADGKRYCYRCRKMLRVGQKVRHSWEPVAFLRDTKNYYRHSEC